MTEKEGNYGGKLKNSLDFGMYTNSSFNVIDQKRAKNHGGEDITALLSEKHKSIMKYAQLMQYRVDKNNQLKEYLRGKIKTTRGYEGIDPNISLWRRNQIGSKNNNYSDIQQSSDYGVVHFRKTGANNSGVSTDQQSLKVATITEFLDSSIQSQKAQPLRPSTQSNFFSKRVNQSSKERSESKTPEQTQSIIVGEGQEEIGGSTDKNNPLKYLTRENMRNPEKLLRIISAAK